MYKNNYVYKIITVENNHTDAWSPEVQKFQIYNVNQNTIILITIY